MGKKKYKVGGLHWLLDYPEVIGVPTARNYGEFDLPAIAPSFLELDPSEIVIRTWNRKKTYGLIPYDQILGVSAGYYTKSSNLYVQNCSLGHTNGLRGLLSPDSDVDDLLTRGKADNPPADDVESYDYGMRIIYRDRAGKYLRIFICVETYMDNPGDYTGFAELLKERIPKEHAGSHFAPKQSHITLESATHNVGKTLPSLTDVARWADAYGYLLVPKDGTQQG